MKYSNFVQPVYSMCFPLGRNNQKSRQLYLLLWILCLASGSVWSQCTLLNDPFIVNPTLSASNVDGAWYPDRYPPNGFSADAGRLKISIHLMDGAQNRPSGFGSAFYNTQGRKFNQCGKCVTVSKAQIYIPNEWATKHRRSDMWATAFNSSDVISFYPIIGFRNIDALSPNFSYWDGSAWVNLGAPPVYDTWYSLEFRLNGTNVEYLIDNVVVGTVASGSSTYFGDIIMQAYNFNDNTLGASYDPNSTYDAFWDNLITTGTGGRVVTNTNTGLKYCSIQGAIDNVLTSNGDVLQIGDAIYNEKVTVTKSLTLDGSSELNTILDGTGLGTGSGIIINNGITGVTIQDLTVKNYSGTAPNSYAGIYAIGSNNNLVVTDCTIKDNVGGCGFYANGPVNGVTLNNLEVSGHPNTFGAARGIVIWNGLKENITITNCEVYNNNCCGIELQDGTCSAVNMSNNNVYDNGDSGMSAVGLHGATGPNTISNNMLNNNGRFGIEIKNPDGNGSNTTVSSNTVSITGSFAALRPLEKRDLAGIAAFRRGVLAGNVDIPTGVTISGNTISGYVQDNVMSSSEGFGIVVEGTNHSVTGNTITGNDVGIQQQAGHLPYPGDGDQSDLADSYFGRGNSPVSCGNTINSNTFSGNGTNSRNNGPIGGAGFVKNINSGKTFCSIQAAINDAQTLNFHELIVYGGLFTENVNVTKSITLKGANSGTNGCSGSRVAESRIDGLAGAAVTISANGVTIDGFELLGLIGVNAAGFNDLEIINNKIYTQAVGVQVTSMTTSIGNTCLIEKNCIDLVSQVFGGTNTSVGIYLSGAGGSEKVTINNNTITDGFYGYVMHDISTNPKTIISNGMVTGSMQGVALVNTVGGPLGMVDIEIVSMSLTGFTGNYPSLPAQNFHAGIYTFTTATTVPANGIQALIQNCTIDGTGSLSPSGAGIYLGDFSTGAVAVQNITIDENEITNNLNRGIDARGYVLATITQNTLSGNGSAPWGAGGNEGFSIIAQRGAMVNAYNNFITHPAASSYPVTAFFTGNTPVNSITANDNSVLMNGNPSGFGAISLAGTGSISAECNWWGVTGTSVPPLMSGTVDYELFLTSGVDDLPGTPGFQPVANSCNGCVNGNSVANINSGEFFCSIQEAINDPQTLNGHTLEVSSGNYSEQVLVTKSLTIKGVGMTQPVIDFLGVVSGKPTLFDISADAVTIDNLHFKVDLSKLRSAIIASSVGLDNITIKNNIVDAYGIPSGSYGDRNAISINYGGPTNYRVATGGVNSIIFQNNTVNGTLPVSFFRSGISIDEGGGMITGNTLQTINHDVLMRFGSNGPVSILNNNLNGGGIELADQNAAAGTITVDNNIFTGAGAPNTAVLRIKNNYNGISHIISNNTFNLFSWAISLENMNNILLDGNTFSPVAGNTYGVVVNTKSISSNSNSIVQVPIGATMVNNVFNGDGTGILFANHDSDNDSYGTFIIGSTGNENNFASSLSAFIKMDNQTGSSDASVFPVYGVGGGWTTTMACWDVDINAVNNKFDVGSGLELPSAMSDDHLFNLEDKLFHIIDSKCNALITTKLNNLYVTDIAVASANNNDYTRIKNAIEEAQNNWTINLKGTFDWTEVNAALSWSLGNDGIVSPGDDYSILVPNNLNGITFTAPLGLGTASILGPGDLPSVNLEGILIYDGGDNQSWTISNLTFSGFDLSIGMFNGAGGTDAYNNTTITNNIFNIPTDLNAIDAPADVNQNIGIHYSFGMNQTISNNIINIPGDGISNGVNYSSTVGMQSNTSGGNVYDGLLISANIIQIQNAQSANPQVILGIWENAHGHLSNITVQNNQFINLSGSNDPVTNLQRGFRVTSHSGASTTVSYNNNLVQGANIGMQWISGSDFSAQQAVQLNNNILNNNQTAILIQSNGKVHIINNDFDDALDNDRDIVVQSGSILTTGNGNQFAGETYYIENLSATGLNISSDLFDQANNFRRADRIYDALDNPASGLIRFNGNNLYVSAPGTGSSDETIANALASAAASGDDIHVESGNYADGFDASSKELSLLPGSSPGCVVLGGNLTLTGGDDLVMDLDGTIVCTEYDQISVTGTVTLGNANLILNVGFSPSTGDQFVIIDNDGVDPVSGQFAQGSAITSGGFTFNIDYTGGDGNDVVLTACTGGVVNTNTGEIFCTIQDAINDPQTLDGHTLTVAAGIYSENIVVNKQLTILGPNQGIDPCSGMRVAEAVVVPSFTGISFGEIFHVAASNVSIKGLTIDGDNTSILSGFTSTNGADIDAAEGITVYETGVNNLTVQNNIFKNLSYFGVTLYDYPAAVPSSGHTISNNKFTDFGTYDAASGISYWGGGVLLYNNQYAWIKDNCMTNLRIGVQTGNFHLSNPGSSTYQLIEDNIMEVRRRGIFHNLFYGTASPYTIDNNNISGIPHASESFWDGILIASQSVSSTTSNNTIDGSAIIGKPTEGLEVWNVKSTSPAIITGGSVMTTSIGLFVNNYEGYVSDAGDGAHTTVSGLSISNCPTGIKILDSPSSTHAAVSATIKDDCEVNNSGSGTGILIEGSNASATIKDNDASINGFVIGIDVNAGNVVIENNHIYNNETGVRFINGGSGSVTTNKFYDISPNDKDIEIDVTAGSVSATPNNWFAGSVFGVENLTAGSVDASLNYWNDPSGPGSIAGGSGAPVSTLVKYCQWLGDIPVAFGGTGLPLSSPTVDIVPNETSFGINNDGIICNGDPVTLDATTAGATGYSWMPGGATTASIIVSPTSTTAYTVTVTFNDCQVTDVQTITVNDPPTFTTCPGNFTVNTDLDECDQEVIYSAIANGNPAPSLSYGFSGATMGSGAGTGSGASLLKGTTTVTIIADNGCSPAMCSFTILVNDGQDPVPTCEMAQTIILNSSCQLLVPNLTDGATATDNCSNSFTWSQNPASGALLASGEGTTHTVTVTADDGNGNSASCTVVLTGNDNTDPVPTCEMAQTIILNSSCQLLVPNLTDGATATDNCSNSFTWSQNPASGALLASGEGTTHTVTVTADDGNGNSASCTVVLTGNDNTDPVPTCEMAQTIILNSSCQLLVPNLTDGATATDNCSNSFTWSQNPASGALLASGEGTTHTVTVTADDGNGNSASCTVVLTGNDNTPPIPVCEDPQNINLNGNCELLVPNVTDGSLAIDNCVTVFNWSQNPTAGSLIPSGHNMTHTITITVNDGNGNSASCTTLLTGKDVTNPVMSCPANQMRGMTEGLCRYVVQGVEFDGAASDNCGITSKTWTLSGVETGSGAGSLSGQYWKKGVTTITWLVSDIAGNTNSCSFTVNVKDLEPPQITCPVNITVITAPGQCSVPAGSVTLGTPIVSDNCGIKYPITNNSPSVYYVGVTTVKWTAKDSSNNKGTCNQKVTVVPYTCGQPVTVYHHDTTHNSAKVSWSAGTCATDYQLRLRRELSPGAWSSWSSWEFSTGPLTHMFSDLEESSFYHYQIRSKCGTSNSIIVNGWFHTLSSGFLKKSNQSRDQTNIDYDVLKVSELLIKDIPTQFNIIAVPNPASDNATINLSGFEKTSKYMSIIDVMGKTVWISKLCSFENEIELDFSLLGMRSGFYLIKVTDGYRQKTTNLIVN